MHDLDNIDLDIIDVVSTPSGLCIRWRSNAGCGNYILSETQNSLGEWEIRGGSVSRELGKKLCCMMIDRALLRAEV